MLKALLKKQFSETIAFIVQGKDGKRRSNGALLGFVVLFIYGFGAVGAMFWLMASSLCKPLVSAGMDWVYFAFMSTLATAFGVIGGIFTAKTKLYEAKDNDLLLSMPIPSWAILFSRMLGLYIFTFLFEALVFVPSVIQYFIVTGFALSAFVVCLLIQLVMPLGALAICCLLGFALAWITAKLPFKNLLTILGFVAFMVLYFLLYSKMNDYLTYVIANGEAVGETMKTALYPFSQLGYAATGKFLSLALFVLMFGGAFGLVYALLSVTYIRIVTMKRGERRTKYKEKQQHISSPQAALFKKELLHFLKSPVYMLNSSMGTLIALVVCVMMAIQGDFFGMSEELIASSPVLKETIGLIVAVIVCFLASSNTIAACAVSLEGERIWLAQSLPTGEWAVLKSKLYLHLLMTAVPSALFALVAGLSVKLSWVWILLVILSAVVSSSLFSVMDLAINLKFPNLRWTNETAAVKQGMSVVIAMFGGWGVALLPLGGYFLFGKYLPAWSYLVICLVLISVAAALITAWLKKRGAEIFKNLSA